MGLKMWVLRFGGWTIVLPIQVRAEIIWVRPQEEITGTWYTGPHKYSCSKLCEWCFLTQFETSETCRAGTQKSGTNKEDHMWENISTCLVDLMNFMSYDKALSCHYWHDVDSLRIPQQLRHQLHQFPLAMPSANYFLCPLSTETS